MLNQFNQPLWGDEGFSAILSMRPLAEVFQIIANDTSPPLWNIFEWLVFNTLGTGEVYIRGLAFSFYLITIFFAYKLGEFLWGKNTGYLVAALVALNPFFFTYAFEGRMYSIMSAGVAGSMYFFATFLFDKKREDLGRKSRLIGYIFFTLWALYSHHFAIFIILTQGLWFLYMLFTKNKNTANIFLGFIGVAIGYLPWLMPLYHQISMVKGGFWLGVPNLMDLVGLIFGYLAVGVKHLYSFPALVLVGALLLLRRWKTDIQESIYLMSWFLLPILAAFIISQLFTPVFYNRYILYTIPGAMILLGSGVRRFSKVAIFVIILLFALIDFHYFTHPTKPRFDKLASYVKDTKNNDDYLINWYSTPHFLWESKYYGIPAPLYLQGDGDLPYFVGTALIMEDDIVKSIPENSERVGIITSTSIDEVMVPGYTESERKIFDQVNFAWFVPVPK